MDHRDFVRAPSPKDVPGYGALAAQGRIPRTPAEPPGIRVRPTAHRTLRDLVGAVVAAVAVVVLVLALAGSSGRFTLGWVQWDWAGVWVLRPDGQVRSAPDPAADPPG